MSKIILETDRLYLRELTQNDFNSLCKILQDRDVMYAWEHAFTDEEVQAWLNNQLRRYNEDGFGLWAVVLKDTDEIIGQCGLTIQKINENNNIKNGGVTEVVEVGYLFQKAYWHNGYATEAATATKRYAFNNKINRVYSIIRDTNIPSQRVAERNGMQITGEMTKHYNGITMPHLIYMVEDK